MPDAGLIDDSVGCTATTVKLTALLLPEVVDTLTLRAPAVAVALTAKVAVIVFALTTVTLLTDTSELLIDTEAPALKFVPVSVTPTDVPCKPDEGLIDESVGCATSTVKPTALLLPAELDTVTLRAPAVAAALTVKVAVIVVALTTVTLLTATSALLIETVEPATKFVPVSVTTTAVPRVPDGGLIEEIVGGARTTLKLATLLVPAEVVTVTLRGPAVAEASIVNDVLRPVVPAETICPMVMPPPPTLIVVDPETKFVPVRVTLTVVPCVPEAGLIDANVGIGRTAKSPPELEPPPGPGFVTPMAKLPEAVRSAEGIVAVNAVEETKPVAIGVPPNVACELATKFVPVICSAVADAPTPADAGVKLETVGAGFSTFTLNVAVPPPGAGFTINPLSVPTTAV